MKCHPHTTESRTHEVSYYSFGGTARSARNCILSSCMKQLSFLKPVKKEHGGAHSLGRRRGRRPMDTRKPLHITLRSELALGSRSLLRHRPLILRIVAKASRRFHVRVYRAAICGNHLHFLVRGYHRRDLQNFFRVVAGHIAQEILRQFPLAGGAPDERRKSPVGCKKNRRKFWALLLYSRVLTWGREFKTVVRYIEQNILEALYLIAYQPRKIRPAPT